MMIAVFVALTVNSICHAWQLVPIAGYDVNDAVLSGHGNWAHYYTGTITPGVNFVNSTFPGTTATYSGVGSGTLNDGIIGTSTQTSQLFVGAPGATDGTLINPAIFLTLSNASIVNRINLYGGDIPDNSINGNLIGVTVTLLKTDFTTISQSFLTTPFGNLNAAGIPDNDFVNLIGTPLQDVPAFAVFLTDIIGPAAPPFTHSNVGGWFSLTEITLEGFVAVPEPTTWALIGVCALGTGAYTWNKRRKAIKNSFARLK